MSVPSNITNTECYLPLVWLITTTVALEDGDTFSAISVWVTVAVQEQFVKLFGVIYQLSPAFVVYIYIQ